MTNKKSPGPRPGKDARHNEPMRTNQDVEKNPDKHIDQDFSGYPHAPAAKEMINPRTPQEKKSAALDVKDGEKVDKKEEQNSEGSAGAFDATERVADE